MAHRKQRATGAAPRGVVKPRVNIDDPVIWKGCAEARHQGPEEEGEAEEYEGDPRHQQADEEDWADEGLDAIPGQVVVHPVGHE